ncbi:MAG: aromatic amino acid lyase, partial [Actinomycetes bacterium]
AEVPGDDAAHPLRLLRSHAGSTGPVASAAAARAMLVVRLNQLGAGGGWVSETLIDGVEAALNAGLAPRVHELGSVGTGDLTALAEAGLSLRGENPWIGDGPPPPPVTFAPGDALAWMSSAALTLGEAVLACSDVWTLLQSAETVAVLALIGVRGDHQSLDPRVQQARPHPGQVAAAAHLRSLLHGAEQPSTRLQDSFAFRCLPQVHGAARDVLAGVRAVLDVELNAAAENPLLTDGPAALHNGNFLMTHLALAVDQLRAALLQVGMSAVRQLAGLLDPDMTGLPAFLAAPAPASSGLMVLEYTAQSALAELRADAYPVNLAAAHASRGVEDLASFADLSVRQLVRSHESLAVILAATLVAATRAVRLHGGIRGQAAVDRSYQLACDTLSPDIDDRPLSDDIAAAERLVTDQPLG